MRTYPYGCHLVVELWNPYGEFVKVLIDDVFTDYIGASGVYIFQCCKYRHQEPGMHVQARLYPMSSNSPRAIQQALSREAAIELGMNVVPLAFAYLTYDTDTGSVRTTNVNKRGILKRLGGKKGYVPPFQHS